MTRDEVLVLLIEECSEVIQAATKCLRFGFHREYKDYGRNSDALYKELGEVKAIVELLEESQAVFIPLDATKVQRAQNALDEVQR